MGTCPGSEELRQSLAGTLASAAQEEIECHLGHCVVCRATLRQIVGAGAAPPLRREAPAVASSPPRELAFLNELKKRPPKAAEPACPGRDRPPGVPGYEIFQELGRGAKGVVYRARHIRLKRYVALKMLLTEPLVATDSSERFRREAEAAASLQHPNILQVYEAGEYDNRPFLALELADGGSLDDELDGTPKPARLAARLLETLAQALHYAHSRGVVHRDLKPANILLSYGRGPDRMVDTVATAPAGLDDAVPKISDFGLAKRLDAEASQTLEGSIVGTPCYMAPEQAAGKGKEIGPAADVYALGAVLYELITGRPPFRAGTPLDTVLQVIHQEPVPPRQLRASVPRDLETICLKCLEKDPRRRYASACDLALDLQLFLDGKPIRARPVGPLEYFLRWCWRNPVIAGLAAAAVALLLAGTAVSTFFAYRARDRAAEADREKDQTRQARREADYRSYISDMRLAPVRWDAGQIDLLAELLHAHLPERTADVDFRGFEWYFWNQLCHSELLTLTGHADGVIGVAYSSDGNWLATASGDGTVGVWDAWSGTRRLVLTGHRAAVQSVAISPDCTCVASAGSDATVRLWDPVTGKSQRVLTGHAGQVSSVAFSRDGRRLVSAGQFDHTLRVWDSASGHEFLKIRAPERDVICVAFSPDGSRLASAAVEGSVRVWDAANGQQLLALKQHTGNVTGLTFSPDGTRLASVSDDRTLRVCSTADGHPLLTLAVGDLPGGGLAFSPDGSKLACGIGMAVRAWDATDGRELFRFKGHTIKGLGVAFSPDGRRLASAGNDKTVKIWEVGHEQGPVSLKGCGLEVNCVAFSPDSRRIASAAGSFGVHGGEIKVWDAVSREPLFAVPGHRDGANSVAFSPDGNRLVSAGDDRMVRIWDPSTGREQRTIRGHTDKVWRAVFSPDGTRVASAGEDHTVRVWDAATGHEAVPVTVHPDVVSDIAFSPDGRRLASACWDRIIRVWDLTTGREELNLRGHRDAVWRVAFDREGRSLASASNDGTVKVWDAVAGHELHTLRGHTRQVSGVAFSPDSRRLASAGWDGRVRVWDTSTGQETLTLDARTERAFAVAFSPDGCRLAAGTRQGVVRLWCAAAKTH